MHLFMLYMLANIINVCVNQIYHEPKTKFLHKQNQPQEVFYVKRFFKNFTKFTEKHLWPSLFFNKVAGPSFPQSKFSSALKRLMRKSHIFILVKLWFNSDTSNFFSSAKYMLIPQDAYVPLYTPWQHQKTKKFPMFSGGTEKPKKKKQTLWPLFMDGVQLP